ncbi:MAG: outer membrane beta-barrel protein [Pseudomonadota bacterium]
MRCVIVPAILLGVMTTAKAEPYVSAFGGVTFPTVESDFNLSPPNGPTGNILDDEFNVKDGPGAGYLFGGAVGYRFELPIAGRLRIEAEGARRETRRGDFFEFDGPLDSNGIAIFTPDAPFDEQRGDLLRTTSVMANVLYETPRLGQSVSFYAGGGAGFAWINQNTRLASSVFISSTRLIGVVNDASFNTSAFQWQAIAGVSAAVTQDIELFVEGRYSRTGRGEDEAATSLAGLAPTSLRVSQPSVSAGLRFSFN